MFSPNKYWSVLNCAENNRRIHGSQKWVLMIVSNAFKYFQSENLISCIRIFCEHASAEEVARNMEDELFGSKCKKLSLLKLINRYSSFWLSCKKFSAPYLENFQYRAPLPMCAQKNLNRDWKVVPTNEQLAQVVVNAFPPWVTLCQWRAYTLEQCGIHLRIQCRFFQIVNSI